MTLLDLPQLKQTLDTTSRDLFRWETLPVYEVASDGSYEGLAATKLYVNSTVELASKWTGWPEADIRTSDDGFLEFEPEVIDCVGDADFDESHCNNLALASFREDLSDEPGLELNFKRVSHHRVRAVADSFKRIYEKPIQRRFLFERSELSYPHSVIVHLTLVTADGFLVLGHRSSRPRFYENTWSATFEEHMKPSEDGANPFKTALRGLKEELVGRDRMALSSESLKFFSIFRELDFWRNSENRQEFWNINVGLMGKMVLSCTIDEVFGHWLHAEDRAEFRHVAGVPYTFENVLKIVDSERLDPPAFADLRVPPGADKGFRNIATRSPWRRQHPTNQIRLIRCLSFDFPDRLQEEVDGWK